MPKLHRYFLTILLAFAVCGQPVAQAAPAGFGMEYGLTVHAQNQDQGISRLKAFQILKAYFPEAGLKAEAEGPAGFMSQREFLTWFEKFRLSAENKSVKLSDGELYRQAWLRVRRNNLLPDTRLTYGSMQEFLYRYTVSENYGGRPYIEGLVLSEDEINTQNFASLNGVREIKGDLFAEVLRLKSLGVLSRNDSDYLELVSSRYRAFGELETELKRLKHPFNQIADMPEEYKQLVTENGLNEVLGSISYNYSKNNSNRIHNLVTGAMKMHGKVYQPGEVIDFTKELGSNGWWDYQYGWVIFGGTEEWQFGGGLCGSATMAFTPSWKAGLEIVSRFPHSVYYKNLYPEESFGLDATIYRGHKNLVMRNSTNDPIMFYVEDNPEKQEITLYLIGNAPYYRIEIEGPIEVGRNTYKWVRRMTQFDGTVVEDELTTHYGLVY